MLRCFTFFLELFRARHITQLRTTTRLTAWGTSLSSVFCCLSPSQVLESTLVDTTTTNPRNCTNNAISKPKRVPTTSAFLWGNPISLILKISSCSQSFLRDMNGKDWELRDEKTQSTFFYNPCGGVHNKACPPGSALCEITNKDIAISYGSAAELTWAEGMFEYFS